MLRMKGSVERHPVLVVGVVVTLILVALSGPGEARSEAAPVNYPSRIVAVTYAGHLVVLDARSGRVVRTLARDAVAENGLGGVSVDPDGAFVYYTRKTNASACDDAVSEIAVVPIDGGPIRSVATAARWPAVSPDGRSLAFTGVPNCSQAARAVVLKSLLTGLPSRTLGTVNVPSGTPGTLRALAWAPDARHLVFTREIGSTYPYVLDIDTAHVVDEGQRVVIGDGSGVSGFLGSSRELLGTVIQGGDHPDRFEFWAVDATTGARTRRLFSIEAMCCGQDYVADESGRSILVTGAQLYRWTVGDRRPTPIAHRIAVATWVPVRVR